MSDQDRIHPDDATLADFDEGNKAHLDAGNMDRRSKGLPDWELGDFIRCNPGKFKDRFDVTAPARPAESNQEPSRRDQR